MAVNLNVISAQKLLEVLGLEGYQPKLKTYGLEIKVETGAITVTHPDQPSVKSSVPVKAGSLLSLAGGTASPVLKEGVAHSLKKAMDISLGKAVELGTADNKPDDEVEVDDDIEFGFQGDKPAKTGKPKAADTEDDEGSMSLLTKTKTVGQIMGEAAAEPAPKPKTKPSSVVDLKEATEMYLPVKGTSPGSVYFVVALADGLQIAARWKGGSLSVRAEGPKFSKYHTSLKEAEMTVNTSYASIHLDVGTNAKLASRALAAVLASMSIDWQTPLPNVAYCKG